MPKLLALFLFAAGAVLSSDARADVCSKMAVHMLAPNSVRMQLSMDKPTYRIGETPVLIVDIKNVTPNTIDIFRHNVTYAYRVSITDPHGTPMKNRVTYNPSPPILGLKACDVLEAGQHYVDLYKLDYRYSFEVPGIYQIQVEMDLYPRIPRKGDQPVGVLKGDTAFSIQP